MGKGRQDRDPTEKYLNCLGTPGALQIFSLYFISSGNNKRLLSKIVTISSTTRKNTMATINNIDGRKMMEKSNPLRGHYGRAYQLGGCYNTPSSNDRLCSSSHLPTPATYSSGNARRRCSKRILQIWEIGGCGNGRGWGSNLPLDF